MAAAAATFSAVSKSPFSFRPPLLLYARRRTFSAAATAVETLAELDSIPSSPTPPRASDDSDGPGWKMMSSKSLGIKNSMISKATRSVLNDLSNKGYDVYLVGGCVRDLVMKKIPKDFDVITSADLRQVRTVIPARASFQEDCARILRAIRIAARLNFRFAKETAHSVKDLASSVMRLDKGRLLMEMNYMLAYGSAEASLRLLWRFGLLELLLPIQAAYFVSQGFRRRDKRSNMLLALFSNLDRLLAPNRPCHTSLWVALLAFHQALVQKPQDPLVVASFTLAIHNGGDILEALDIAKGISHPHDDSFPELLEPQGQDANEELLVTRILDLASSVNAALSSMTDEYFVSQAMQQYPEAPYSDLVYIPLQVYLKACKIFECISTQPDKRCFNPKDGSKINYTSLTLGATTEVRHVFARVVFDTVYPPK